MANLEHKVALDETKFVTQKEQRANKARNSSKSKSTYRAKGLTSKQNQVSNKPSQMSKMRSNNSSSSIQSSKSECSELSSELNKSCANICSSSRFWSDIGK